MVGMAQSILTAMSMLTEFWGKVVSMNVFILIMFYAWSVEE